MILKKRIARVISKKAKAKAEAEEGY